MDTPPDLVCLSHLRWGFVYQRPNHLMARCARDRKVLFFEEPHFDSDTPYLEMSEPHPNLFVGTPHLPEGLSEFESETLQRDLLRDAVSQCKLSPTPVAWLYTPMALPLIDTLSPSLIVFDAMDELSAFRGAPPRLLERETELFGRAHLVFTGGQALYESKRSRHPSVHAFPSSVETEHFSRAREPMEEPHDQRAIARPRVGYFGVIDERLDLDLLANLADSRPDLQVVMVGPVVKIDENTLPRRANIHYLGGKNYADLPAYLAGWDVAMMPFALNEATEFISPTKTLEYLAAGKPIVSTAIRDVVRPYGENESVIISTAADFPEAVDRALRIDHQVHLGRADSILSRTSWDRTWESMNQLITAALEQAHKQQHRGSTEKGAETCSTI